MNKELSDQIPRPLQTKIKECGTEQELEVYRVAKKGIIDEDFFLSSIEEYEKGLVVNKQPDKNDMGSYSTSCDLDLKNAKKILKVTMKYNPPAELARGITKHGLCQETHLRTGSSNKSHVDWWIYKGASQSLINEYHIEKSEVQK